MSGDKKSTKSDIMQTSNIRNERKDVTADLQR